MVAKDYNKTKGSGKAEVGEIDTSAPFQSVKDAVSLFGEGAFSGEKPSIKKPKPYSAERVLAKETQLHLAQKELNKLKEQLKNAETTKTQALLELDRSKWAVEDLTQKLKSINKSKDLAIAATEATNHKAKQFSESEISSIREAYKSPNTDLKNARAEYMAAVSELNSAKQDLRKICQEYEASSEMKSKAIKQAEEAEDSAKANTERVSELSREIASVHASIQQANFECALAKEDEKLTCAEKDKQKQSYKTKLEDLEKKLVSLKKELDPKLAANMEAHLAETLSEIEVLRNDMDKEKGKDSDALKTITLELDGAKESLNKVAEEEHSLRRLVETVKAELDEIKKEHVGLKEKEVETESLAGNLHVKLRKAKSELEEAIAEEARARGASDEMVTTIRQLASESRDSRLEAEEMRKRAHGLKAEAEATRAELEEAERKLRAAEAEAEEAKAAEARALDLIRELSEKADLRRASTSSEGGGRITISREEFESLSRKAEESGKLADIKVEAAMAQVEAVKASENEALKKLESSLKEIEDMKSAAQEALKKAEMADAARKAVEGELRRWREREQKKAVETASRILEEKEKEKLVEMSPRDYRPIQEKPRAVEAPQVHRKLEKSKTSVTKKVLMPSLSSVFHRKKNKVEGGSPSYLPGEKRVW
ncbi:WEB family protein [Striga hermonthica]|uniref:WEB family protein n=1 Tax=Striga hermonthica TaxID=68872 RepID=A0A9N7MSP2_STRHE|nr:WEB family protein [Striga hermonthica]